MTNTGRPTGALFLECGERAGGGRGVLIQTPSACARCHLCSQCPGQPEPGQTQSGSSLEHETRIMDTLTSKVTAYSFWFVVCRGRDEV